MINTDNTAIITICSSIISMINIMNLSFVFLLNICPICYFLCGFWLFLFHIFNLMFVLICPILYL